MFAFEVGETTMRSATFERVMADTMDVLADPADRQVVSDALTVNCLWVDDVEPTRRIRVVAALYRVLGRHLESGEHRDNEVALLELATTREELARRYPQYVAEG
jgi:DnaJ-domain-containing protein 1